VPTITRWFRVTHDINSDPEIWELRELHGDRAALIWLECLSIADRNQGLVGPDSPHLHAVLASKCRVYSPKVRSILTWCLGKGWLQVRPIFTPPFGTSSSAIGNGLWISKWAKYNKRRESDESLSETTPRQTRQDRPKKKAQAPLILPDWIDQSLWSDYKQMRIHIGRPLTKKAESMAIDKLNAFKQQGENPTKIIEQSIFNSWQGLFAVKHENGNSRATNELSQRTKEILRRGL